MEDRESEREKLHRYERHSEAVDYCHAVPPGGLGLPPAEARTENPLRLREEYQSVFLSIFSPFSYSFAETIWLYSPIFWVDQNDFELTETVNVNRETLLSLRTTLQQENRDWDWWSWFLARHYFGGPSEARHWDSVARSLVRDLNLHPGMKLLDIGSGCGELEFRLAQQGITVLGIDNSDLLIEDCQKLALHRGIPARFERHNMFDFTPTSRFNAIICINTSFGYGTDQQNRELIEKIPDWLEPHGKFYLDLIVADNATTYGLWSDELAEGMLIVDNNYEEVLHVMTSLPHWTTPDDRTIYSTDQPERVQLYTIDEIESMLESAGLHGKTMRSGPGKTTRETGANMTRTWLADRIEKTS